MPVKNRTFPITEQQIEQIAALSQKTGLPQSEIVRRALDSYFDREFLKEYRQLFTDAQRRKIKRGSIKKGITEREYVREAVDREP